MTDLAFVPAHRLAQMIRDRQVSAVEVLDAYLVQIAQQLLWTSPPSDERWC
jgi:amidase